MPQTTVTIKCSFLIAKRLGAVPCSPAELNERHKNYPTFRYFKIIPIYDMGSSHGYPYWKWPVVQPENGTMFSEP